MDNATRHLVFVYGTLKRGQSNHGLLAGAEYHGEGATADTFGFYAGPDVSPAEKKLPEIPFAYEQPAEGDEAISVQGEVWEVDNATLAALDRLEGHPDWYERRQIPVTLGNENKIAYIYLIPGPAPAGLRHLSDGRFLLPISEQNT